MKNWSRSSEWRSIDSLGTERPIILADETQTIMWFSENGSKAAVDHKEHERDPNTGHFQFDDKGEPKIASRKIKPAFWATARID